MSHEWSLRVALWLTLILELTCTCAAMGARLEAVLTWDTTNYGIRFTTFTDSNDWARSEVSWGGQPLASCGGGQPQQFSTIPGGSWSAIPCGGHGPVTFTVDPLYATTFAFHVQMWQAPRDFHLETNQYGTFWVANAPEPVTITAHVRVDGVEVTQGSVRLSVWDEGHYLLTYTPDATGPVFDLTDRSLPKDRRVVLTNTRNADNSLIAPYPHYQGLLGRDRTIPVALRTYVNGVATSGVPVTLRVLDPPDPSPYITGVAGGQPAPGAALSHDGDNTGVLPTLGGTGVTSNGDGTYTVTSGENGFIAAEMTLDATARPGDNYRVQATFSGTPTTATSGLITAWRRMFFEKRRMFRGGNPMVTDAPAGVWHVVVPDATNDAAGSFAAGDNVILLHAPKHGETKPANSFYQSYNTVAAVTPFTAPSTLSSNGPGTLTFTAGSATITGSGTRFGRLVAENATAVGSVIMVGPARYVVTAIANNTRMTVTPVPQTSGSGLAYKIGDDQLVASTSYVRLTLGSALSQPFYVKILSQLAGQADRANSPTLNDAVAKVATGGTISSGDYFDGEVSQLVESMNDPSNPMPAAYAEYLALTVSAIPVPRAALSSADGTLTQAFFDKWFTTPIPRSVPNTSGDELANFHYEVPSNHQLILVADTTEAAVLGTTPRRVPTYPHREMASAVYRGFVERATTNPSNQLYQLDPDTILRKIVVHEIAHQYRVDNDAPGHCQRVSHDSTAPYPTQQNPPAAPPAGTLFCTMAVDAGLTMPATWNPSLLVAQTNRAYGDGHVAFHMNSTNGVWDSEYLTIRQAADPWLP